ncbi:Cytochrome b559 subunit alpha [Platanthera zijinensis]|uniref:Cytochrome b559 subunit alpha n=1 Tax=Platanthera zijinensis TaxID=2320716 RepID=A0AAP0GCW9_9ASPA
MYYFSRREVVEPLYIRKTSIQFGKERSILLLSIPPCEKRAFIAGMYKGGWRNPIMKVLLYSEPNHLFFQKQKFTHSNRLLRLRRISYWKKWEASDEGKPSILEKMYRRQSWKAVDSCPGTAEEKVRLSGAWIYLCWLFVSTGLAYDVFGSPRPNVDLTEIYSGKEERQGKGRWTQHFAEEDALDTSPRFLRPYQQTQLLPLEPFSFEQELKPFVQSREEFTSDLSETAGDNRTGFFPSQVVISLSKESLSAA